MQRTPTPAENSSTPQKGWFGWMYSWLYSNKAEPAQASPDTQPAQQQQTEQQQTEQQQAEQQQTEQAQAQQQTQTQSPVVESAPAPAAKPLSRQARRKQEKEFRKIDLGCKTTTCH